MNAIHPSGLTFRIDSFCSLFPLRSPSLPFLPLAAMAFLPILLSTLSDRSCMLLIAQSRQQVSGSFKKRKNVLVLSLEDLVRSVSILLRQRDVSCACFTRKPFFQTDKRHGSLQHLDGESSALSRCCAGIHIDRPTRAQTAWPTRQVGDRRTREQVLVGLQIYRGGMSNLFHGNVG